MTRMRARARAVAAADRRTRGSLHEKHPPAEMDVAEPPTGGRQRRIHPGPWPLRVPSSAPAVTTCPNYPGALASARPVICPSSHHLPQLPRANAPPRLTPPETSTPISGAPGAPGAPVNSQAPPDQQRPITTVFTSPGWDPGSRALLHLRAGGRLRCHQLSATCLTATGTTSRSRTACSRGSGRRARRWSGWSGPRPAPGSS